MSIVIPVKIEVRANENTECNA